MRVRLLFIIVFSLITLSACNVEEVQSTQEEYKIRIEKLERENSELRQQLNKPPLTLNYIETLEKRRFINQNTSLRLTPESGSQILNTIEAKTVVEVYDFVEVNEEIWLYVAIPVFDSPTNIKGWIKETETQLYTAETQKKMKRPIVIKEGTNVYKVDLFTEVQSTELNKLVGNRTCFLSDEQDDFVAIGCAGGESFIVKKSDVIFPPIDEN